MEPGDRAHGDVKARFAFLTALNEIVPAALDSLADNGAREAARGRAALLQWIEYWAAGRGMAADWVHEWALNLVTSWNRDDVDGQNLRASRTLPLLVDEASTPPDEPDFDALDRSNPAGRIGADPRFQTLDEFVSVAKEHFHAREQMLRASGYVRTIEKTKLRDHAAWTVERVVCRRSCDEIAKQHVPGASNDIDKKVRNAVKDMLLRTGLPAPPNA